MTATPPSAADSLNSQETRHEPQPVQMEASQQNESTRGSVFKFPVKKYALTILLVGETGSGKTSFLSLLLNLLDGKGPFELEERHDLNAESGLDKTQSQTTEARLYNFTTTSGVRFQIIDTPGLADTRAIKENSQHKERIYRAIKELATKIDGIMLIASGRNERLSVTTAYSLQTLGTFFPRSIKNNIGIIFTNEATHWKLDNPLSTYKLYRDRIHDLSELERQKSRQARRLIEDYDDTVATLNSWLEWLDTREAVSTTAIIELYHKSTEIESRLFGTTLCLENLSRLRKELQGVVRDLEAVGNKQLSLAKILDREPPKIWELIETSDYNTICLSSDCHSNCHLKCNLELSDPEDLGGCDSSVKCSQCEHEASEHRNYRRLYQEKPSPIYEEATRDLQGATASEENLRRAMGRIQDEIEKIEEEIEKSKREIPHLVDEMNNISLSPNYAGYIWSAIKLFELRKKHLESHADSEEELSVMEKGIKALKSHLDIIADTAAGRVVSASSELRKFSNRLVAGPSDLFAAVGKYVFQ